MRKFTGWPIICLTILLAEDTIADLNVSSKIDLDSSEIQLTSSDRPVIISNQRERIVDVQKEPLMIRINEQPNPWLHRSTQSFIRSSFPEDLRKRRTHLSSGSATNTPNTPNTPNTVVNNVRIFVNENETEKGSNVASCENGVCDVSVSSKIDDEGNIVTDVHITIITNTKPNIEVAEIPVIDGFRGIEENIPRPSSPVFHPLDHVKPTFTHFLRNDIPQVQVRGFVEPNNGEIHFQDRRNYGKIFPATYRWYNGNNHEQRGYNKGFQDSRSWLPRRVIVDDKIEAPLSKTKQSEK